MSTGPSFNSPDRESETLPRRSAQSEGGSRSEPHSILAEAPDRAHSDFGIRHSDFPPPPSRHRRRIRIHPTEYDEILADAIYDLVRLHGHSDVAAAACYGVSASAIKRWLREHEDFAADLDAARAEFKEGIVEKIRYATKPSLFKWGVSSCAADLWQGRGVRSAHIETKYVSDEERSTCRRDQADACVPFE